TPIISPPASRAIPAANYPNKAVYNPPLSEEPVKRIITLVSLALLLPAAWITADQSPAQTSCDRECLRGFITQYLNAMVAHNPKTLPLAPNARFTEDTKTLPPGEGLWKGASGLRSYRQDFLDVREGMAAAHVIVEEDGKPIMLALRLKIANKKI